MRRESGDQEEGEGVDPDPPSRFVWERQKGNSIKDEQEQGKEQPNHEELLPPEALQTLGEWYGEADEGPQEEYDPENYRDEAGISKENQDETERGDNEDT